MVDLYCFITLVEIVFISLVLNCGIAICWSTTGVLFVCTPQGMFTGTTISCFSFFLTAATADVVAMGSSADSETMQKINTADSLQIPTSLAIQPTNISSTRKVALHSYVNVDSRKLSGCRDHESIKRSSDKDSTALQTPEKLSESLQKQLSRDLEKKYGSAVERKLSREVERKLSHYHDEGHKQAVLSSLIKKVSVAEDNADHKISFESYLQSIPRLDPVDRTIGWIVQQPDDNNDSPVIIKNLPLRGTLIPNPKPTEEFYVRADSESSISRCESARGTPNRGTPPALDYTQPRLDEQLQQLLRCHQQTHLRKNSCASTNTSMRYQMFTSDNSRHNPEITADILPFITNPITKFPLLSHKNPNPYLRGVYQAPHINRMQPKNLNLTVPLEYACEWSNCHQRFASSKELFIHVEADHICTLPICQDGAAETELCCQWRRCPDCRKPYPARYKLLVHVQNVHCKDHHLKSAVSYYINLNLVWSA